MSPYHGPRIRRHHAPIASLDENRLFPSISSHDDQCSDSMVSSKHWMVKCVIVTKLYTWWCNIQHRNETTELVKSFYRILNGIWALRFDNFDSICSPGFLFKDHRCCSHVRTSWSNGIASVLFGEPSGSRFWSYRGLWAIAWQCLDARSILMDWWVMVLIEIVI